MANHNELYFFQRKKVQLKKNGQQKPLESFFVSGGNFSREPAGFLQLLVFKKSKLAKSRPCDSCWPTKLNQTRVGMVRDYSPRVACWGEKNAVLELTTL